MEYLKIAENFAKKIWPYKEITKIRDIMLFGSVAYGKQNPNDIDLLLLHHSEIFEVFQDISESKKTADLEKLTIISNMFKRKGIDLSKIFEKTKVIELISKNKFNIKYMDIDFFRDNNYKRQWTKKNKEKHKKRNIKKRLPGEEFEDTIFRQGLLWNPETRKYDIKANKKYNPRKVDFYKKLTKNPKINSQSYFARSQFSSFFLI